MTDLGETQTFEDMIREYGDAREEAGRRLAELVQRARMLEMIGAEGARVGPFIAAPPPTPPQAERVPEAAPAAPPKKKHKIRPDINRDRSISAKTLALQLLGERPMHPMPLDDLFRAAKARGFTGEKNSFRVMLYRLAQDDVIMRDEALNFWTRASGGVEVSPTDLNRVELSSGGV